MKIIITDYFKKKFLEKNKKYFSIDDFLFEIKDKKHKLIPLNKIFFKQKFNINNVSFRWVLTLIESEKTFIPLFLFLKKDKKKWENISYPKDKDFIEENLFLALNDLENDLFDEYEI